MVSGKDETQAMYEQWTRRYPDNGTPHTRHVTTNLILDVDDDAGTGTCRSYITVFQKTDVLPLQPILAGRYHDRFERVDGTWRFAHRHMINDYLGDLSQHMLADPFPDRGSGQTGVWTGERLGGNWPHEHVRFAHLARLSARQPCT